MEISPIAATIILFGALFILLITGVPLTFILGGIGVAAAWLFLGTPSLYIITTRIWAAMNLFALVAIPLFVFMAGILQRSGLADALYDTIYKWMGGLRGGLAAGTIVVAAIFAAMSGVSAAATVSLGLIALPSMLERKYDKVMVTGAIQAGGALGILIPPSVSMIVFAVFAEVSVGRLFIAGVLPGLLSAAIFIAYILVRCGLRPSLGPPLPVEERASWREKFVSLRQIGLPVLIVLGVLGSIYMGIATPTEAASVGVLGVIISAAVYRRLNRTMLKQAGFDSLRLTVMIMWISFGAYCYSAIYTALGATKVVEQVLQLMPGGAWGVIIGMQLSFFVLGCMLDPIGIIMITAPIYLPLVVSLGFDPVWFGVLYVMNMEMGFLTPPFGFNLFYMKAVVPPSITMVDIYRSIIPFVGLQALCLAIVMVFPQIAMWLPGTMMK
jgi:tripartite ATP-independent transporter DctM subunit